MDFVHRVVEFLLQHTTDIVELDRFFTDSSEFPLPAMDPNYVVGKLKKYSTGISFSGTQKQLNAFFQALGERAALGNEQQQLVTQLSTALSEEFESGNPAKPTMRAYFMHAVFPAYVEAALNKEHPEAWVLAFPVLSAQARVLRDLKLSMDSAMFLCVNSTIAMLATTLDSFRRTASMALGEDTRALTTVESYLRAARMTDRALSSPHVVATLTLLLRALVHAIPLLAWIYEDAPRAPRETARDSVDFLVRFAVYARRVVGGAQEGEEVQRPLDVLAACRRPESVFGGGRRLAKGSLLGYLKRWERGVVDGTWFVSGRAVVVPEVGEGWREEFGSAVEAVLEAVGREGVFGGGAADDGGGSLRMRERKRVGVQVVLGRLFC